MSPPLPPPPPPSDGDDLASLRRSEALFRGLLQSAPDAIVIVDGAGLIRIANRQVEALFGYAPQELIGQPVEVLIPAALRSRHAASTRQYHARPGARPMGGADLALRAVRKDGQEVLVEISLGPLVTEGGTLVSAVIRDVTERRRLEQRVAMAERLAAIGTMAAGLAHELNNPVAAVLINVELADQAIAGMEHLGEATEALSDARDACRRVHRIVDELKRFARTDAVATERVDLRRVVDAAVKLTIHQVRAKARLVVDRGAAPAVDASEDGLVQVLTNLLVNAAQAIPDGAADAHEIRVGTRTDEEGRAVIEVADTGCGIPAPNLARMFEPFFTTKPPGVGTGLGLAISQKIITSIRGRMTVESTPGRGTTFRIVLPPVVEDGATVSHRGGVGPEEPASSRPSVTGW